ncbi:MAG TPA: S1/P1 Nuclease [Caulobacteraceae bacterium]|nr:S1/P1 Nuclease [Caulobacteraceae bacterium]
MKYVAVWWLASVATLAGVGPALAWGGTGHRWIGRAAIETLPDDLPTFLRTKAARDAVGELSREPDRSRGSGKAHDSDRDPGHFVDGDDDGRLAEGPLLTALPPTREEYETALRAVGATSWKIGYLPYSIVEDWQQLKKDFAYWRADDGGARHTSDPAHRAWLEADRAEREQQILVDIGTLSHFVGDGSMPLHVTVHFNGWGPYPNPNGYTTSPVHTPWEGTYVRLNVPYDAVLSRVGTFQDCSCPIEQRAGAYLATTLATVIPFYELEKSGAFREGGGKGLAYTADRLAAGATELRDEIVLAWRASEADTVGYKPMISVADIEAGKVDPYDSLYGGD